MNTEQRLEQSDPHKAERWRAWQATWELANGPGPWTWEQVKERTAAFFLIRDGEVPENLEMMPCPKQ